MRQRLGVFAAGTKTGGGSGFENLVHHSRDESGDLRSADVTVVVSNHECGGVRERADRLGIRFIHMPAPWDRDSFRRIIDKMNVDWIALSGWLKMMSGHFPERTFNIHPALLSQLGGRFGGPGIYGHHVHEAVALALARGEISESGFSMHFVPEPTCPEDYDRGPVFFEHRIPLCRGMTTEAIAASVNIHEHRWQPIITDAVVSGCIRWDGISAAGLVPWHGFKLV